MRTCHVHAVCARSVCAARALYSAHPLGGGGYNRPSQWCGLFRGAGVFFSSLCGVPAQNLCEVVSRSALRTDALWLCFFEIPSVRARVRACRCCSQYLLHTYIHSLRVSVSYLYCDL